ncbi:MAG: hypothetical protein WCH46_04730 [bacterium]
MHLSLRIIFFGLFLWVCSASAQVTNTSGNTDSSFHPQLKPTLNIKRRTGEIKIDGNANDAGWQDAIFISRVTIK